MTGMNRREAFKIAVAGGLAGATILAGSAEEAVAQAAAQGATPTFRLLLVNAIAADLPVWQPSRGRKRPPACRCSMPTPAICIRPR